MMSEVHMSHFLVLLEVLTIRTTQYSIKDRFSHHEKLDGEGEVVRSCEVKEWSTLSLT